jgi:hypothetical protein
MVLAQPAWAFYSKKLSDIDKLYLGKEGHGRDVKISAKIMTFPKYYPKQTPSFPYYGFYGVGDRQPEYSISNLVIWIGKIKKGVPISAYLDLTELHQINIQVKNKSEFTVLIDGGDAGNSYKAILYFNEDKLIKRQIVAGEEPDILIQETKYYQTE